MTHQGVWILAEQKRSRIHPVSFELLARGIELARQRGCQLTAVVIGHELDDAQCLELVYHGADRVVVATNRALAHFVVEAHATALEHLIQQYRPEVLIAAATTTGRTLMPYTAVRVGTGLTADCTELAIDPDTGRLLQTRPAIGGNILATIQTPDARPQMATVRPRSSKPSPREPHRTGEIMRVPLPDGLFGAMKTRYLGFEPDATQEVDVQEADTVVAGGRGMAKAENFVELGALAAEFHGAIGASRDAVDRGWAPYPCQIGLSGKTVSPRLYIACGISGAVQHMAGMQTAETIVAINRDPDAQIFRMADFGIVGDIHELLPMLTARLKEHRKAKGDAGR